MVVRVSENADNVRRALEHVAATDEILPDVLASDFVCIQVYATPDEAREAAGLRA